MCFYKECKWDEKSSMLPHLQMSVKLTEKQQTSKIVYNKMGFRSNICP